MGLRVNPQDNVTFVGADDVRAQPNYIFNGHADDYLVNVSPYEIKIANNTTDGVGEVPGDYIPPKNFLATVWMDVDDAEVCNWYSVDVFDLGIWTFFGDDEGGFDADVVLAANYEVHVVPIPGALWLLGSGLVCLIGLRRRNRKH